MCLGGQKVEGFANRFPVQKGFSELRCSPIRISRIEFDPPKSRNDLQMSRIIFTKCLKKVWHAPILPVHHFQRVRQDLEAHPAKVAAKAGKDFTIGMNVHGSI